MELKMSEEKVYTEEVHVKGEELLSRIKELQHEGNVRRIILKDKDGGIVMEIPLSIGVFGTLLMPTVATLGAVAALVTEATLTVEKIER